MEKVHVWTVVGASVNMDRNSTSLVNLGGQLPVPTVKYCCCVLDIVMQLPEQTPVDGKNMNRDLLTHICGFLLSHLIQVPLWAELSGFH